MISAAMGKSTLVALTLSFLLGGVAWPHAGDDTAKSGNLLARHLDAIGSKEARSAVKTRVVQGVATYRIVVGGGGQYEGKAGLVSEGQKVRFVMKFNRSDYIGENFLFDGKT